VCKVIIEHIFEFLSAGLTQICMEVPYFAVEITGTACENQTTEEKLEVCVLKILRRTRYIEKDIRGRGLRKKQRYTCGPAGICLCVRGIG